MLTYDDPFQGFMGREDLDVISQSLLLGQLAQGQGRLPCLLWTLSLSGCSPEEAQCQTVEHWTSTNHQSGSSRPSLSRPISRDGSETLGFVVSKESSSQALQIVGHATFLHAQLRLSQFWYSHLPMLLWNTRAFFYLSWMACYLWPFEPPSLLFPKISFFHLPRGLVPRDGRLSPTPKSPLFATHVDNLAVVYFAAETGFLCRVTAVKGKPRHLQC